MKILFISKGDSASSTRYRALQFFPLWQQAGHEPLHITAAGGVRATIEMLRESSRADIVIVLRKTFPRPIFTLLRRTSRKLIFDFDDAIFCNTDGSASPTRMSRFATMAGCCDHLFAGNLFLASQARRFNQAVSVVPTVIDPYRYRVTTKQPEDFFDLVWIGSRSTRKYLQIAMPWLAMAAKSVPNLRLKIIADFDLPDQGIRTMAIPWNEAIEAEALASSHVGIAPMHDDDWSRGKCALKVLQYMAAGLPVISSPSGTNAEIVQDGITGYLAATSLDWVQRIIELAHDQALREALGNAGCRIAEGKYSLTSAFGHILPIASHLG